MLRWRTLWVFLRATKCWVVRMYRTVISLWFSRDSTFMVLWEIDLFRRLFRRRLGVTRKVLSVILICVDVSLVQTLDDLLLCLVVISRLGLQIVLVILFVWLMTRIMSVSMVSCIVMYSILRWMCMLLDLTRIVTFIIQIATTWLPTLLLGLRLSRLLHLVLCLL